MLPFATPPTSPPCPGATHGPVLPGRDGRRLRADRAGARDRQPDARRRARQRRAGPGRAVDAEPPRADRRRDRNGQDEDAPAARGPALARPACRSSSATSRATCRGSRAPGDATNPKVLERAASLGWTFAAGRPPGRVPVAVGDARRAGPGDRPLVRAAAARQGPRSQRDADLDPRPDLQVLRRQQPAAARPRRTSRRR